MQCGLPRGSLPLEAADLGHLHPVRQWVRDRRPGMNIGELLRGNMVRPWQPDYDPHERCS
jgi:hypothetical protein